MSGSTITGTVTIGITLGSAGYYSPLFVETTGSVIPLQNTIAGVLVNGGLFTNDGTVVGGGAYRGEYQGQTAGNGVDLSNGVIVNNGLFLGGRGEFPDFTTGAGISVSGGTLTNNGTITGGQAVNSSGCGLLLSAGTVTNAGTISGNTGFSPPDPPPAIGQSGGTGVVMSGGRLINDPSGVIAGSQGGAGGVGSEGGVGALLTAGTFVNEGLVIGGQGGPHGGSGGIGISMDDGVLLNTGTISGGIGTYSSFPLLPEGPSDGVDLAAAYVVNDGVIMGGEVLTVVMVLMPFVIRVSAFI